MASELTEKLTRRDIWVRALYMMLFVIAYGVAEILLALVVVFQFFAILFTGRANEPLLRFGTNLSTYVYQILKFLTFNAEQQPFPFSDWPNEEHEGERWLEEPAPAGVAAAEPPEPEAAAATPPEATEMAPPPEADAPPKPDQPAG